VLDLPAVQALLDDRTTLVSYWVLGDKGTLAFIVTGDSFTTVELPDATSANLSSAVDNTLSWTTGNNPTPSRCATCTPGWWRPCRTPADTPGRHVPHQQLQYAPFAALSDGQTYFGQQHLLSVIPSASALPFIQQNAAESAATANTHALVFGNPATGDPACRLWLTRRLKPRRSPPCWAQLPSPALRPARPACAMKRRAAR